MRKQGKKQLRDKADNLCRQICYLREKCEAKGTDDIQCKGRKEWSHLETRAIISIRYENWNYVLWCSAHHWYYDLHTIHKSEWIKKNKGLKIYNRIKKYKPKNGEITEKWYFNKIEELKKQLELCQKKKTAEQSILF